MVGLRQLRSNFIAKTFAQSVLDQAQELCEPSPGRNFTLGRHGVAIRFSRSDRVSSLIAEAFPSLELPDDRLLTNVFVVRLSGDGISFPDFEWAREWIDACAPIPTTLTSPYRIFIDKNQGVLYCYDEFRHRAAVVLRSASEIDSRSLITPFRILWSWIGGSESLSVIHAGAISLGGQGVLLPGPSGSGKSTLSYGVATHSAGQIVADDCVVVEEGQAYALYSRVKVSSDSETAIDGSNVCRVPDYLPEAYQAKPFVQLEGGEGWFRRQVDLSAIVFPVIAGKTGYYRLDRQRAQRMLTADSLRELYGGTPQDTIRLAKLAGALPSYRLLLGDNLESNIRALEDLLAG
jgi:hypothetical protein